MTTRDLRFTVDARLLRELGERLVGKPHIALAELIKNAYDADASVVCVSFRGDQIIVEDNGHGMTPQDFEKFWMRVGTTHKQGQRFSRKLARPLTGSKGVGRLAVQLLSRRTEIETVGLSAQGVRSAPLRASADWNQAVNSENLTNVVVPTEYGDVQVDRFPEDSVTGTRIVLSNLTDQWTAEEFKQLARELWSLQPPHELALDDPSRFEIRFEAAQHYYDEFNSQMSAILEIWSARVVGKLLPPNSTIETELELPPSLRLEDRDNAAAQDEAEDGIDVTLGEVLPDRILSISVEFRTGESSQFDFRIPRCPIQSLSFDIRIFTLKHRQGKGISVTTARDYLSRYGGIGVYDTGFRLPYYGPDEDWVGLELAHSARLSHSSLLPAHMNVANGLHNLPTNRRIYGRVNISTGLEALWYGERRRRRGLPDEVTADQTRMSQPLAIQVTRDRLVPNRAYDQVRVMVRAALDAYAMEQTKLRVTEAREQRRKGAKSPAQAFSEVRDALDVARDDLPAAVYDSVNRAVANATRDAEVLERNSRAHTELLGSLATAGIISMAYDHEINKHIAALGDLPESLARIAAAVPSELSDDVQHVRAEVMSLMARIQGLRKLFTPLIESETRTSKKAYRAGQVVEEVGKSLVQVTRGTSIDVVGVPRDLRLPAATLSAWWAIFQNILINSFNALIGCEDPHIRVTGGVSRGVGYLIIQDNGVGVDLKEAARFFEPFERKVTLPADVIELGLGGTGLGLTIVRMIGDEVGAKIEFVAPESDMRTATKISWEE